jgi:hypothetical protein
LITCPAGSACPPIQPQQSPLQDRKKGLPTCGNPFAVSGSAVLPVPHLTFATARRTTPCGVSDHTLRPGHIDPSKRRVAGQTGRGRHAADEIDVLHERGGNP